MFKTHQMTSTVLLALALFLPGFIPTHALAQSSRGSQSQDDGQALVALCDDGQNKYTLYADALPTPTTKKMKVLAVSDELEVRSGLHRVTDGIWNLEDQSMSLPAYWKPNRFAAKSCHSVGLNREPAAAPPIIRTLFMFVRAYFIMGDPRADIDLDALIANGSAFPVKIHVLCRTRAADEDLIHCSSLLVMEQEVQIDSRYPASINLQDFTAPVAVTLESRLCSSSVTQTASAAPIQWNGETYLLTAAASVVSDHGTNSCTTAQFARSNGAKNSVELVKQDWGSGLALLRPPPGMFPRGSGVEIANTSNVASAHRLQVVGADENELELLSSKSHRHRIPLINVVSEITGSPIDSALIGSAVLDSQQNFYGLVSHQNLEIHPGGQSRVRDGFLQNINSDHLLVINRADIFAWLTQLMSPPPMLSPVMVAGVRTLDWNLGGIQLNQSCPDSKNSSSGPIGGAEPVGIGGEGQSSQACWIEARLTSSAAVHAASHLAPNPASKRVVAAAQSTSLQNAGWASFVATSSSYLRSPELVERIAFGVQRDLQNHLVAIPYLSNLDLLQSLANSSSVTALPVPATAAVPVRIDSRTASTDVAVLAADLLTLIRRTKDNLNSNDTRLQVLLRQLQILARMSQSHEVTELRAADFDDLLLPNSRFAYAWGSLQVDVTSGRQIRPALERLTDAWTKAWMSLK